MGLFDLFKKKVTPQKESEKTTEDFDRLDKNGELPWGWHTHNKAFTEKINKEYSYFLNMWIDSKGKEPKKQYEALKSFVMYLEDVEKLCKSKGECFEFWFYEILTSHDYLKQRKEELNHLTANLDELQEIYEKTPQIKPTIELLIKENDGILQSELKKMFDDVYQEAVSNALYELYKEGKIEKIKSGRSYTLHYRG
jgi:hypothetical protein